MGRRARAGSSRVTAPDLGRCPLSTQALRLVFAGTPEVALPSLDALLASRHEVVAVVTRPDAPAGRGRSLTPSPVKQRALDAGLEVLTPRRPSEPEFLARLAELAPDCCPVVAYGALVPRAALDIPRCGWVNLHFSLLPAWRGAAPVQHAVLAGDEVTGATTFRLEEGLDTGPVYGVVTETVRPTDTAGELLGRLAAAGAGLLVATIDGIADGSLTAVPQAPDRVSHAPKLTPADVRIDWSAPAMHIDRLVRAATPAPGAWTTLRGKRVKVLAVSPAVSPGVSPETRIALAPGEVREVGKSEVYAGTATGPVRLLTLRPEGKGEMTADAWARGLRLQPGERFE